MGGLAGPALGGSGSSDDEGVLFRSELEVTITGKRFSWLQKAWHSAKKYIRSFEVEGSIVYSIGIQAGAGFETPLGNIGFEGNAFSVDIGSIKDIINGVNDAKLDYIGNGHWMTLRQGAGIDLIFGGASIERKMKSPTNGGAFFDKEIAKEANILGVNKRIEYYQKGLQTESYPIGATSSEGVKFGFNVQFLLGAKFNFEIRRRR